MPDNQVHFKLSFKEINIEFDGDMESAQIAQSAVNNLLNSLTEIQNKLLLLENRIQNSPSVTPIQTNGTPKGRSKRRNSGDSPVKNHVIMLRQANFFAQKRLIGDVKDELSRRGHVYKSEAISAPLLALTKQSVLSREKNEAGQWIYFNGEKDGSETS